MDQWDQDYVDEEVEGYFEFQQDGKGSFHFGYMRGEIDYRIATRDGEPCIEFTWDGSDEMEPEHGSGWAVVDNDELNGIITFHQDDQAAFKCRSRENKTMTKLSYAIVFVSDMDRSVAFYKDTLGLPLKFQSPEWSKFATGEVGLALHATSASEPVAPAQGATPSGQCQLGFYVEDIDAFHEEMVAKGVTCIQPPKLEDFGAKLARYTDPDGQQFSVSERQTT